MRTLAIGDIHGCHTALKTLLKSLELRPDDQLIFLGDYVDRGVASRQVIETLLEIKKSFSCVFLRGNHEVMMLESREDSLKFNLWRSYGGLETLESYGVGFAKRWIPAIPGEHWNFIESTQKFYETDTHILVHACLDPDLDLNDQPNQRLYWEFIDRLKPHKSGKQIICGHTPQRSGKIRNLGFALCIDTAPVGNGWLTALDINAGNYWQANERGQIRRGALETD